MKKFLAVLSLIALCSCAAPLTSDKLAAMSNDELCKTAQIMPDNLTVATFIAGRKLRCHPIQQTCIKAGFKPGGKGYEACIRANSEQMAADAQERRRRAAIIGAAFQKMGQPSPRPVNTNCYAAGNQVHCTTY